MNSRMKWMARWVRQGIFVALALFVWASPTRAWADDFSRYQLKGSFSLPPSFGPFDVLPDGRLVVLVNATVDVETSAGSHAFVALGTLPSSDISSFGAAFLRVSPNGSKIAVGNNGGASFSHYQVGVFSLGSLSTGTWFSAAHFDGEWIDERYVALTAGNFGSPGVVTALDTQSPSPGSPSSTTLVTNIGGASGGIVFDAAGNLFTGNGFASSGPSGTGDVRAVLRASWQSALSGGAPINFETQGIRIVDVLSASPLGIDAEGNLLVGGGDGASDVNYGAIVRAAAVASALAGGGPVNPSDPNNVRRLDPDGGSNFYTLNANAARHEVYFNDFGSPTVYVYAPAVLAAAPATPLWTMALLSLVLVAAATRRLRGAVRA